MLYMNTQLTQSAKDSLYEDTKYLIDTIYYISNGKVLHAALIALLEEMNLKNKSTAQIKSDITALIKAGFLKKKQVLSTNANILILTAFPISKLEGKPSRDVSEIPTSKKAILESICRIEFIINTLHEYRLKQKTSEPFDVKRILRIMQFRNSTVCVPLKGINNYLLTLHNRYDSLLSGDFLDDYKYLEVIRMERCNNLSKSDSYTIDPDWQAIKDTHIDLQETMTTDAQNKALYNIYNLKNSSADINFLIIEDNGQMHIRINIYDNGNLSLERITALTTYFFLMFDKYNINYEKPFLYIFVQCSNEDIKTELENEASKRVPNFYGMRDATKLTQGLVTSGIRVQYLDNIEVSFINLHIDENYHIFYY